MLKDIEKLIREYLEKKGYIDVEVSILGGQLDDKSLDKHITSDIPLPGISPFIKIKAKK